MFRGDADAHGIELTSEIHPSLTQNRVDWAMLDPQRISQVLINLTTNAIKFTKDCPVRSIKIQLRAALDPLVFENDKDLKFFPTNRIRPRTESLLGDVYLLFTVADSGPGISSGVQSRLFQRFSQGSLRTHIEFGGSGLGLWISRELTEMQGGRIGLRTGPSQGTTFAFYVRTSPASPPPGSAVGISMPIRSAIHGREEAVSDLNSREADQDRLNSYLKSLNVLLTEDNLINQKVMRKQLQKIFGKVLIANHGGEAIDVIQRSSLWKDTTTSSSEAPDLILMDIEMPVLNGVECTRKIREFEAQGKVAHRIPIIAVSANARIEQISEYREAGMDDVLSKPFVIRDLVALIGRLLQHNY